MNPAVFAGRQGLAHIAICVRDLEAAKKRWTQTWGATVAYEKTVEEQGVKMAALDVAGVRVELLEPLGPDTPVGQWIRKRGEGLHHLAFYVPDLEEASRRCEAQGVEFVRPIQIGSTGARIRFVKPASTGGVLLELVEKKE